MSDGLLMASSCPPRYTRMELMAVGRLLLLDLRILADDLRGLLLDLRSEEERGGSGSGLLTIESEMGLQ